MPEFLARLIDPSDPFASANITLYFAALFVYVFTALSIWASGNWAWRCACFLINQIVTIGLIVCWSLVGPITGRLWPFALAMMVVAIAAAMVPRMVSHRRDLRRKYYF